MSASQCYSFGRSISYFYLTGWKHLHVDTDNSGRFYHFPTMRFPFLHEVILKSTLNSRPPTLSPFERERIHQLSGPSRKITNKCFKSAVCFVRMRQHTIVKQHAILLPDLRLSFHPNSLIS
jgi:hypothetical protein